MSARRPIEMTDAYLARRLERFTMPEPNTGCWLWTGCVDEFGYGRFTIRGKRFRAHRLAYRLAFGSPRQPVVMHRCDVPRCVNPAHLKEGTRGDNNRDRHEKGRDARLFGDANPARHHPRPCGVATGTARLDDDSVRMIRQQMSEGADRHELATRYGVHPETVRRVAARKCWRHVQ